MPLPSMKKVQHAVSAMGWSVAAALSFRPQAAVAAPHWCSLAYAAGYDGGRRDDGFSRRIVLGIFQIILPVDPALFRERVVGDLFFYDERFSAVGCCGHRRRGCEAESFDFGADDREVAAAEFFAVVASTS